MPVHLPILQDRPWKSSTMYIMYTRSWPASKISPTSKIIGKVKQEQQVMEPDIMNCWNRIFYMYIFNVSQYMQQGNIVKLQFCVPQILGFRDGKHYLYGSSQMPIRTMFLRFYPIPDHTPLLGGSHNNIQLEVYCISVCKNEVPEAQQNLFRPRAHYKKRIKTQVFCIPHTSKQHRSYINIFKAQ